MKIKEICEEEVWENFISAFSKRTFLHSWDWTEFRRKIGDKIYRRGLWTNNDLAAVFFASKIKAKKGNFLLVAHGPLIKNYRPEVLKKIIEELKEIGKKEKAAFLRIAPLWSEGSENDQIIAKEGFLRSSSSVFPTKSWELSLAGSENDILSGMRKGTRYMIAKGEKDGGMQIFKSQDPSNVRIFYDIYKETSLRHKFKPFSFNYIQGEFAEFSAKNHVKLFLAEKNNRYIAGAIIIFWQNRAFYHHGASVGDKGSVFASHLIQWEAIKEARARGCDKYNFWVISPNGGPKHRWAGLTFFKKGFGGNEVEYALAKDLPLTRRYWITRFWEKARNIR